MLKKDFLDHEVGKSYLGLDYDLNFLIGKYAFLESQSMMKKCTEIVDRFYNKYHHEKVSKKIDNLIDKCVKQIQRNEETDIFINNEFCIECHDSCCNLRNIGFFTFGDIVRLKSLSHDYPDIGNFEKKLNEKCCFLQDSCIFPHDYRPIMCVISICTDWGIVEPDLIFENVTELKEYKKNGNQAYIYQRDASKIILETIYEVKIK